MNNNKLFVGGLAWALDHNGLRNLFETYGEITEAIVISDRETGRSKGFGFVTFVQEADAQKALEMDGKEIDGRNIVVNIAKPKEDHGSGRSNDRYNRR